MLSPTNTLTIKTSPEFEKKLKEYPKMVRPKILHLQNLVREVAETTPGITKLEECLKWGEPSFLVKGGSTLRMDWKKKTPDQYMMYFQCSSQLVPTFRIFFDYCFEFEGNRAIILQMDQKLPETELINCIGTTLNYHKLKHLPMLGF